MSRRIDMREKDTRRRREKELPFSFSTARHFFSSLFSKHFLHTNHHLKSSSF
jgi:hypothetical protein